MENIQKQIESFSLNGTRTFFSVRMMDAQCFRAEILEYSPRINFAENFVVVDKTGEYYLWSEGDTMQEAVAALDLLCANCAKWAMEAPEVNEEE